MPPNDVASEGFFNDVSRSTFLRLRLQSGVVLINKAEKSKAEVGSACPVNLSLHHSAPASVVGLVDRRLQAARPDCSWVLGLSERGIIFFNPDYICTL